MESIQESRKQKIPQGSDRNFGLVFGIVLLVFALWPLSSGGSIKIPLLFGSLILFLVALAIPSILRPGNILWFKIGLLLGAIVTPLIMLMVYFIVVVPTGLIMRILGRDLLDYQIQPKSSSYWIDRKDKSLMENQF